MSGDQTSNKENYQQINWQWNQPFVAGLMPFQVVSQLFKSRQIVPLQSRYIDLLADKGKQAKRLGRFTSCWLVVTAKRHLPDQLSWYHEECCGTGRRIYEANVDSSDMLASQITFIGFCLLTYCNWTVLNCLTKSDIWVKMETISTNCHWNSITFRNCCSITQYVNVSVPHSTIHRNIRVC